MPASALSETIAKSEFASRLHVGADDGAGRATTGAVQDPKNVQVKLDPPVTLAEIRSKRRDQSSARNEPGLTTDPNTPWSPLAVHLGIVTPRAVETRWHPITTI